MRVKFTNFLQTMHAFIFIDRPMANYRPFYLGFSRHGSNFSSQSQPKEGLFRMKSKEISRFTYGPSQDRSSAPSRSLHTAFYTRGHFNQEIVILFFPRSEEIVIWQPHHFVVVFKPSYKPAFFRPFIKFKEASKEMILQAAD